MNYKLTILATIALAIIALNSKIECSEEEDSQIARPKIEPATTTLIVSALVPVVMNILQGFLGALFGPSDYQDTIIFNRSMRVKLCGDNCVQITDRGSGITVVGTGSSTAEAMGDASKKLFDELLSKNILSVYDLCNLHITFPHPNQQICPGVQINTCDFAHPTVFTTKTPCVNKHGDTYCDKNKARCDNYLFQTFMREYCLKTCSNGLCVFDNGQIQNPCKITY